MASDLNLFKIQVPRKIDDDALKDGQGRWWIKIGDRNVEPSWTQWDNTNEYYCWFTKADRPEEGEFIQLFQKKVQSVYQYRNIKRAVIKLV